MTHARAQRLNLIGGAITVLTVFVAVIWAFPLYWGVISSLKPEDELSGPISNSGRNVTFATFTILRHTNPNRRGIVNSW